MRETRKYISIILFVVMIMNSVICAPVYAEPNGETETIENEVFDGENTEDAIETTTESVVEDDVESPSSIIIDILDKVLKNEAEDEILSGAAIDYEIDESSLPSDVSALLDQSYEGLSDYEKFAINTYLFVREDTMEICYDKGYLIRDSVPYALLMQTMEIDFSTAENMMVNYESQKAALESAKLYSERLYEYACFKDENIKSTVKDYIIDGYNIDDVLKAYGIAVYTGKDIADVIRDKDAESLYAEAEITDDIINLCEECYINAETAKEIAESDDYENFAFDYSGILKMLKEGNDEAAMFATPVEDADIGYDSAFKKGALSYIEGLGANVDPNTGAISYTENICNIPGVAGLDLNISLVYSSSANCSYRAIDHRVNYGHNWRYSFPFLTNDEGQSIINGGMSYLTLSSGDTYEMVSAGGYYIPSSIYTDEIKLYNDNAHQGGTNSYYKLTYKNGNTDYFNNEGLWIKTVDKFGNKIEVTQSSSGLMKIKDTNNNIVTIQMSGNVQTITRPDNSKITINYSKSTQGVYTRYTLDKITYPGNVSTEFSYEFSNKDNYRNALLNKIKTATGLEKHFAYSWTDKLKYSWNTNYEVDYESDKYDYARINEEYLLNDGKVCDKKTYTYDSSFMVANSNFAVKCLCCKCGEVVDEFGNIWSCKDCVYIDYDGDNVIDANEWIGCAFPCTSCCSCTPYYNGGSWSCFKNCAQDFVRNCPVVYMNNGSGTNYSTTITSENGTILKYTFNFLKQNISIEEYLGGTLLNKTTKSYLKNNDNCDLPTTIKYTENGAERTEKYTYTNKYDVKSYVVTTNSSKELSSVSYNYDYESNSSNYYGLCTKVTTKMNDSETIVQNNTILNDSTSMSGKVISKSVVTRGSTKESSVSYTYDTKGRNTASTAYINSSESQNVKTTYTYSDTTGFSAMPVEIKITGAEGSVKYTYDKLGNVLSVTNQNNCKTSYTYDGIGNITRQGYYDDTGSEKSHVSLQYDYSDNTISFTNENGKVEVYDYDPVGNPEKITKGGSVICTYTYDNRDRLTSEVIKEGTKVLSNKTYTYENNSTGLKTTEKIKGDSSSADITNITQADVLGRNTMVTDQGDTTYYTYDMLNNVIKSQNYIGKSGTRTVYLTMDYTYDSMGNVLSTTRIDDTDTANAKKTYATYDMLGRMITSTDGKGNTTEYTYNVLGLVTNKKVPFSVDNNGNMQYTNYGYTYDAVGNVTKDTVTSGVTNTYTYDYRNRVTQVKSGEQTVDYVYDNVGNIVQYKTGNGTQVHKYEYDSLNRVVKYTDALNNSETYTYDGNQDMIKKVDRNGKAVNYTYDGLHRVLTEKADGVNNSWTYGLTGGVLTETNANAVKTYKYNSYGLPSAESTKIGSDTFRIDRYYDTRGNDREDNYYKNGTVYQKLKYVYDNKNRLAGVYDVDITTGTQSMKAQYGYDKNDNNNLIHYGNGGATIITYNEANLPVRLYNSNGSVIYSDYTYNYRLDGNMSGNTEKINGETRQTAYTYDSTGRLTREAVTGYDNFTINYTYDSAGNRTELEFVSNDEDLRTGSYIESYTYDKNNRLTETVINKGSSSAYTEYTYDKNGNQTRIEKYTKNNDGIFKLGITWATYKNDTAIEKFTYNGLNQLVGYESTNGQYNGKAGLSAEYKYMADGYRLSKSVNGYETRYLWDKDNIAAELNNLNVVSQNYYRGYNLISDDSGRYYMHNAHGDVVDIFAGTTEANFYYYNAFGTTDYFENTDYLNATNKWGYCDQLYDWETGNYYMRARYYNPDTGRFISEDTHWNPSNMIYGDKTFDEGEIKYPDVTASLQAGNLYAYCMGNPVLYMDSSGNIVAVAGALGTAALIAIGKAIIVAGGVATIVALNSLANSQINELIYKTGYDATKKTSSYLEWRIDANKKNHVINGSKVGSRDSRPNHEPIWKKLGFDPNNNPDDWNKLQSLFFSIVNERNVNREIVLTERGKQIGLRIEYFKDFVDEGVRVIVQTYTNLEGKVYFSDAWGEIIK